VIFGGEALDLQMLNPWFDRHGDERPLLVNMYGITETTVHVTYRPVTRADVTAGLGSVVGRPIADLEAYILDSERRPVPVGVPGELYIGGAGLARGYLNRPELTAEKFIAHPFSNKPGTRLYKTGDLCRYLFDGDIEYVGRIDHQVKIRGFRVELGEIEAALVLHPTVCEAVATVRPDTSGDARLIGYVIPGDKATPTVDELRSFLGTKLPGYMVPATFVLLEHLPRLPNGKVDRLSLPDPDSTRPDLDKAYVAPRTDLERLLAEMWQEVLGIDRIGVHDDFFELGGDSLQAVRLIHKLEEELDEHVYAVALFDAPNIANLAGYLVTNQASAIARRLGPASLDEFQSDTETLTTSGAMTVAELSTEAVLDPAIRPTDAAPVPVGEPTRILLTGATGFLGAFLLGELLERTQAEIYCLVRVGSVEDGAVKVRQRLESCSLWNESWRDRITAVPGDLSRPRLGLSDESFTSLAQHIDEIYHNGALVNFVLPYSALKPTNVLSTQEVLRLACQGRVKPVHVISALSVAIPADGANDRVVMEADGLDTVGSLHGGYSQSKWIAEKLVMLAGARGLPVTIYRPGRLTGHSLTGFDNTNDLISQVIQICIKLEMVPDVDVTVDFTPVNYVSRAIMHLSRQNASVGMVFHLVNRRPVPWGELVNWIRGLGYPLESVSPDRWLAEAAKFAVQSPSEELMRLATHADRLLSERVLNLPLWPEFDCSNTIGGLTGTDIVCPTADAELIRTYLSYFIRCGLISEPRSIPASG
jgi:thioester reductase-like protein